MSGVRDKARTLMQLLRRIRGEPFAFFILCALQILIAVLLVAGIDQVHVFSMGTHFPGVSFIVFLIALALFLALSLWWVAPSADMGGDASHALSHRIFLLILVVLALLFVLERIMVIPYWHHLRLDFEQGDWMVVSSHLARKDYLGLPELYLWRGWYNNLYAYLLAAIKKIWFFESRYEYMVVSAVIAMVGMVCASLAMQRLFSRGTALFVMLCGVLSAYSHMMTFYLKQNVMVVLFFGFLSLAVAYHWRRASWVSALLLALVAFSGFLAYVGLIYYLPCAVLAVLLEPRAQRRQRLLYCAVICVPTLVYLAYLFANPEVWPHSYVTGKAVWAHRSPVRTALWNIANQIKMAFAPGGIWGPVLVLLFYYGVVYLLRTRDRASLFLLGTYAIVVIAQVSTWDQELGHNIITLVPYLCIVAVGALYLLKTIESSGVRVSVACLIVLGVAQEVIWFTSTRHWPHLYIVEQLEVVRGRLWYLDDAQAVTEHVPSDLPVLVGKELRIYEHVPTIRRIATGFSELRGILRMDFSQLDGTLLQGEYQPGVYCEFSYLTERLPDAVPERFPPPRYTVAELHRYRPNTPRYDVYDYETDVHHVLYVVRDSECQAEKRV